MFQDDDVLTSGVTSVEDTSSGQRTGIETDPERSSVVRSSPGEAAESGGRSHPQITFMGNSYDLAAVVAAATGGVIVLSCVTCNSVSYCLPILPVVLGLVGLLSAENSADPKRTRLLSWLGIGSGGVILLLMILAVILYIVFIVLAVTFGAAAEAR